MNSSYGKIKIYPRLIEKFREIYTEEKICWNFEFQVDSQRIEIVTRCHKIRKRVLAMVLQSRENSSARS